MVRAFRIAVLASAALAIPVPVPVPTDGPALADDAFIPTTEELEAPTLAAPTQADDAGIPDVAEWTSVDNGDKGGVEDVSEPKIPVQRRVVDAGDLDTGALDTSSLDTDTLTSALNTDSLNTESLDTSSLTIDSLTTALPTSANSKRRSAVMW